MGHEGSRVPTYDVFDARAAAVILRAGLTP